ncbi:unnamed protein product [Discosporangium mesarthrocarpum]
MSAWMAIHPVDVVKTRMQLQQSRVENATAFSVAADLVRKEGPSALYVGLSAALARQASYTTLRLGLYDVMKTRLMSRECISEGASSLMFMMRLLIGIVSGGIAAFCACPVEVCLVRMQADGNLPLSEKRHYKGVLNALFRIAREEGVLQYWRGAGPTVLRAMVVSVSQIVTYDQAKEVLSIWLHGGQLHLAAGIISAVVFSFISMPLDTVKTRMQQAQAGNKQYRGTLHALVSIAITEGLTTLWKGFGPYFCAKGVMTVILFLIKEKYTTLAELFFSQLTTKLA